MVLRCTSYVFAAVIVHISASVLSHNSLHVDRVTGITFEMSAFVGYRNPAEVFPRVITSLLVDYNLRYVRTILMISTRHEWSQRRKRYRFIRLYRPTNAFRSCDTIRNVPWPRSSSIMRISAGASGGCHGHLRKISVTNRTAAHVSQAKVDFIVFNWSYHS